MVVPSHCLPVYGCTGVPSFCAICFWHGHDVIHPGNHQFKVPYFLPSERDRRYQNVLDRLALPLKEWLHLVFFISDEFAILGLVNVFWLGCDLPKGASQRPWSKQLRVKFKLNSIEWMTPCDLVPQFLTAHGPGFWSILYHVPPFHSCEHPSLQGWNHWFIQMKHNPGNRMKNPWNWKLLKSLLTARHDLVCPHCRTPNPV